MIPIARAVPIDLSQLDPPTIIDPLDPEQLVRDWIAALKLELPAWSGVFDQDPFVKACYVWAKALTRKIEHDNQRCRAVLLATSTGSDLDHLAATYYADLGLTRLVVTPADPDAVPHTLAVMESDDRFRRRITLAPEAYSCAGPEGGYQYWALTTEPQLLDARVLVSNDIERRLTLVTLLPAGRDAAASNARISRALAARKPASDVVSVRSARPAEYQVRAVIYHGNGADPAMLQALARTRIQAVCDDAARRVGQVVGTDALIVAGRVAGVSLIAIEQPLAHVDPGADGVAICTSIEIRMERADA